MKLMKLFINFHISIPSKHRSECPTSFSPFPCFSFIKSASPCCCILNFLSFFFFFFSVFCFLAGFSCPLSYRQQRSPRSSHRKWENYICWISNAASFQHTTWHEGLLNVVELIKPLLSILLNYVMPFQVVYIAPLKAIVRERMIDWKKRLVSQLGKKMVLSVHIFLLKKILRRH